MAYALQAIYGIFSPFNVTFVTRHHFPHKKNVQKLKFHSDPTV
jgi:hypothetical protein